MHVGTFYAHSEQLAAALRDVFLRDRVRHASIVNTDVDQSHVEFDDRDAVAPCWTGGVSLALQVQRRKLKRAIIGNVDLKAKTPQRKRNFVNNNCIN